MMETALYFKINFEGMTGLIRDIWAEGNFHKCLDVLDSFMDVSQKDREDIIRGKRKLAQDPDGKDGVDGLVVDDNWQPNLDHCAYGIYPDPKEMPEITRKLYTYKSLYLRYAIPEARRLLDERKTCVNGPRLAEIDMHMNMFPDEVFETLGFDRDHLKYQDYYEENPINNKLGIDLDAYIKRQLELDKMPMPKPDKDFSQPLGWILPTGKFYSCGYMEHDWLAGKIGNSPSFSRTEAAKMGWIEITHPLGQENNFEIYFGAKEPTQKQLDTLFDWQQKYEGEVVNPAGEW